MKDALKFKDLKTFLAVTEAMGYDGEIEELVYEQGILPYYSAFLIPTELLPEDFDFTKLSLFGGSLTQVEAIQYLGIERFTTDFMIYRQSMTGYLEVDTYRADETTQTDPFDDPEGTDMNFVINIEDGGGKEFFYAQSGKLVSLNQPTSEEPKIFKTGKQADKMVEELSQKYSDACQIYVVEQHDFDERRGQIQSD